ncbi:GAP family protein [Mycolicibacterium novocastrense]|nr:GAP family protein [Mycolicibacterium novocastrense]
MTSLSALNPVRLALTLLVVSRSRPVQNVLAFWCGCLAGAIPGVVLPLTLIHVTGISDFVPQDAAASGTVRHVQIGAGVIALSVAALMTVRFLVRRRQHAPLSATNARVSAPPSRSNMPATLSRLLGESENAPDGGGSLFRRVLHRARSAWQNGSLWIAFVIGLVCGGPQPDVSLFVVAIIVGSGAAVGTQIMAATVFVVGTLGIIELILVSYLVTPQKTRAVLRVLHDWASRHRGQILVAIFTVIGIVLVAKGLGGA